MGSLTAFIAKAWPYFAFQLPDISITNIFYNFLLNSLVFMNHVLFRSEAPL